MINCLIAKYQTSVQPMNREYLTIILFCLLLSSGCSKPGHIHAGGNYEEVAPRVVEVKLTDTIARSFVEELRLEDVSGISFQYSDGVQANYFAYEATSDEVLHAVSRLAFPLRDARGEVSYHEVTADEWLALKESASIYELTECAAFWEADPTQSKIYASVKRDHHLLIMGPDGRTQHRIKISPES